MEVFFLILLLYLTKLTTYSKKVKKDCLETTNIPSNEDISTRSLLIDGELQITFSYPLYFEVKQINSTREEEVIQFNNSLTGEANISTNSKCSFLSTISIPNSNEDFENELNLELSYYSSSKNFKFPYLFDYRIKNQFNIAPESNTIDIGLFQIIDYYEKIKIDTKTNTKKLIRGWFIEIRLYGDEKFNFVGFRSKRPGNSSTISRGFDKFNNFIILVDIYCYYEINEPFETEILEFVFENTNNDKVVHGVEIHKVHTGFVSTIPFKDQNNLLDKESAFFEAVTQITIDNRNQSFSSVSISSQEKMRISTIIKPKLLSGGDFDNIKYIFNYYKLICINCYERTEYTYISNCKKNEYYLCVHQSIGESVGDQVEWYNATINIESISPGNYRVETRFEIIQTQVNQEDKKIYLESFSHVVVSSYHPIPSLFQMIIFAAGATLGLFAAGGGITLGMYVMRVMKKSSEKNRVFYQIGKQVKFEIENSNVEKIQLLDLSFRYRHKEIEFKPDELKAFKKSFKDIFKIQKASKYTPYVHCKYCYIEQRESGLTDICCKCGLPLLSLLEFEEKDKFCIVCSLMNKYQPRPHGRCLLHLSSSKKKNVNKQGAVYVLFRDHFSVGSASRQLKKSNKNDWIERVTQPEIWRLNSLLRFEFIGFVGKLIHKKLKGDKGTIRVLNETLKDVRQKYQFFLKSQNNIMVFYDYKSEHLKRLKINLRDKQYSKKNLILFFKYLRESMRNLIDVLEVMVKYFESEIKRKKRKKRKRNFLTNSFTKKRQKITFNQEQKKEEFIPKPNVQQEEYENILTTEGISVQNLDYDDDMTKNVYNSETDNTDSPFSLTSISSVPSPKQWSPNSDLMDSPISNNSPNEMVQEKPKRFLNIKFTDDDFLEKNGSLNEKEFGMYTELDDSILNLNFLNDNQIDDIDLQLSNNDEKFSNSFVKPLDDDFGELNNEIDLNNDLDNDFDNDKNEIINNFNLDDYVQSYSYLFENKEFDL